MQKWIFYSARNWCIGWNFSLIPIWVWYNILYFFILVTIKKRKYAESNPKRIHNKNNFYIVSDKNLVAINIAHLTKNPKFENMTVHHQSPRYGQTKFRDVCFQFVFFIDGIQFSKQWKAYVENPNLFWQYFYIFTFENVNFLPLRVFKATKLWREMFMIQTNFCKFKLQPQNS